MYEVTQQINAHVLDASAPLAPPSTGFAGDFIAENLVGIVIIVVLGLLVFGLLRRRYGIIKFGIMSIMILLLPVLTLQPANLKAAPGLTLDAKTIDVTIRKPALSATATSTLTVPSDIELYDYNVMLKDITDNRVKIELNGITLTNDETLVAGDSDRISYTLNYTISITNDLPSGNYVADLEHDVTEKGEVFKFTVDTRMTDTIDTDPTHYDDTATSFAIPTSGRVNNANNAYNWIINCGGGQANQIVSGTSSVTSAGIDCNYATPGEYQITIRPNGAATPGWLNGFGFYNNTSGANVQTNKNFFKSIDTPFTNNMRTPGSIFRFAYMFYGARNAASIPAKLFYNINTSSATNLSGAFLYTFDQYAYNSTTATIPVGLFNSVDVGSATNLSNMFSSTFRMCAYSSATATIPAKLFDSIDTSRATNLGNMFFITFYQYAHDSTVGTIPAGLFDSINTSNATNLSSMFIQTFSLYAYNSTTGTIPAGLFSSIDTSRATALTSLFSRTFDQYAFANKLGGTPDTDINTIWGGANLSRVTATNAGGSTGVFYQTFYNMPSLTGTAQTFIDNKLGGINPTGWAYTFTGTGVIDYASLDPNWQ